MGLKDYKTKLNTFESDVNDFKDSYDRNSEEPESVVTLWRVDWNSDYKHVVAWDDKKIKDFFGRDTKDKLVLEPTSWRFINEREWKSGEGKYAGNIILDIPREYLSFGFNYVQISKKRVLPYNNPHDLTAESDMFYFITESNNVSPGATQLFLQTDIWTSYFPYLNIQAVNLIRGHAMLTHTADEYLKNPLTCETDFTEPEPDLPSVKSLRSYTKMFTTQTSEPIVCVSSEGGFGTLNPFTDKWSNSEEAFKYPVATVKKQDDEIPNLMVYAMKPDAFTKYVNICREINPIIFKNWKSIYILPSDFLNLDSATEITYNDVNMWLLHDTVKTVKFGDFELTKDKFNYPKEYADYAKLYTGQFAQINIANPDGSNVNVNIETLAGGLEMWARVCSVFPFLKFETFVNGIKGAGYDNIAVRPWDNRETPVFHGEVNSTLNDLQIPTFSVFCDPKQWVTMIDRTRKAISEFDRDTVLEISKETAKVTRNAESNTIENDYSNTLKMNKLTFELADNSLKNAYNDGIRFAKENQNIRDYNIKVNRDIRGVDIDHEWNLSNAATLLNETTSKTRADYAHLFAVFHDVIIHQDYLYKWKSIQQMPWSIGAIGAALDEGLSLAFSAIPGLGAAGPIQIDVDQTNYQLAQNAMYFLMNDAWDHHADMEGRQAIKDKEGKVVFDFKGKESLFHKIWDITNKYSKDRTNNISDFNKDIADRTKNKDTRISSMTQNNEQSSITANYNTGNVNAANTRDTTNQIAEETRDTQETNSVNKVNHANWVADKTLWKDSNDFDASRYDKITNTGPVKVGEPGGNGMNMIGGFNGVTVSIDTLTRAQSELAANVFKLYGYRTAPKLIMNPDLSFMTEFTFWECENLITTAPMLNDVQEGILRGIFTNGVTLWNDPLKVKQISLENRRK